MIEKRGGIIINKCHFETYTTYTYKINTIFIVATLPIDFKFNLRECAIQAFSVTIYSPDKKK